MYLKASKYLGGGWKHSQPDEQKAFRSICRAAGIKSDSLCANSGGMEVSWTIAYWRKANQIHKWFVEHVQAGDDNCQSFHVTRDQLQTLLEQCIGALARKDGKILPPQSGFFFGSTDIDEGYWQDIRSTITQLEKILKNPDLKCCDFYYQSSW